ncbi:MAG: ketoacyl-ACP synthase III [Bacteroidetes bacterium]|nr:MAG: ketoacyl-ACP synthase III [Bacteroidota bacterium]MBL1143885.1 ketoacyl-ACP synthase III [Bacteroidota bacterium]MCB0801505.1 ketoacyl-ACP synthase III [Flavobacteriales bacterium]NOG56686.1 ketoacyl-ACP synthase III [Bacteroidota bacterium]
MNDNLYSVIRSSGSFIPPKKVKNEDFLKNQFYDLDGNEFERDNQEIIKKFFEITTISERRYADEDLVTSDIAYLAAKDALKSAGIDKEELSYIIVAHNFGDVKADNKRSDMVPTLAARVKYLLKIENPNTIAYDLPFGCPGWLQAIIQANYYIKSGDAKHVLVIGAEILSRVSDPHDRDSMIYADGAGAVLLSAQESKTPIGILGHKSRSDTFIYSKMLYMGKSFKPTKEKGKEIFLKMNGGKLYRYALETVPSAIKDCLEECNVSIKDVKKILIHQANGKMDDAILKRLFGLYNIKKIPDGIMPMTIDKLGNSSVATLPTLLDLILKKRLDQHEINKGDYIVFASVGAGMNINAVVYRF